MSVLIETSQGDIVIDLYVEKQAKCCLNFLKLCKLKYYNYTLVHTVQRNFIAQAGDPTGTGEGGGSIWGVIKGEDYRYFEAVAVPHMKHQKLGTVSMVNNGHDCYGSQFLITLGEGLNILDGKHTVFGEVAEGEDVLMKINEAYCDKEGRPYQDIRIYHTVVLEDPYDDPEGLVAPDRSPSPPSVVTDSNRIGAEEDIDEFKGKTEDEIKELVALRESKANAQILEMVGDIPDADAKPPENVLFVCKLNPATTGEDLEIIFSRFGPIQSCEVIKDHKTGDSLQYAFIEFENEEDCVNAYFKMDNVLIDDRRIHVDFSQSLAKVKGIHRRKSSETQPSERKDDGFVAKRKPNADDGYEMVFEDAEARLPGKKKRKRLDDGNSGSDSERRHLRHRKQEGETSRERKGRAHTRWHGASEDEHHREHKSRDREERRRDREEERGGGRREREREEEREGGKRGRQREDEREEEREGGKRGRQREDEREEEREGGKRGRQREERGGGGRRGRERGEDRGREREKERRREREEERRRERQRDHRSRSRSRERHHKHSRDRSRSHERRHRH